METRAKAEEWQNGGDYDTQLLSGEAFHTATVTDCETGDPIAIVYGRTTEECRDRAEEIAKLRKPVAGGLDQSGEIANLYREAAKELHAEEGTLEIDGGAIVSDSEEGAYVAAWVWVGREDVDGLCRECGGLANDGEGYDGLCGNCADKAGQS